MSSWNLKTAVEAGGKARLEQEFPGAHWDERDVLCQTFAEQAREVITASLSALADAMEREWRELYESIDWEAGDEVQAALYGRYTRLRHASEDLRELIKADHG